MKLCAYLLHMSYYIDHDREFAPIELEYPLIHYAKTWEVIQSILNEGFRPSYCKEFLSDKNRTIVAAFPMISFSNMEVTASMNLMRSYGTLGIAMKKAWGEANKLNPVLYLDRSSDITAQIVNSFDVVKEYSLEDIDSSLNGVLIGQRHLFIKTLINTFSYSKNYDAPLVRGGTLVSDKYSFGLEREWRLVINEANIRPYLIGAEVDNKSQYSEQIALKRIDFKPEDIETIIIETEYQQEEVIKLLLTRFGDQITLPRIIINTTRHIPDYD